MTIDKGNQRPPLSARVLHGVMIASVVVYCIIIYILVSILDIEIFTRDDSILKNIIIIISVISVLSIINGIVLPHWFINTHAGMTPGPVMLQLVRMSSFNAVGVFGLILAILGAETYIPAIFLAVSAASLALSYPTETNWKRLLERYEKYYGNR